MSAIKFEDRSHEACEREARAAIPELAELSNKIYELARAASGPQVALNATAIALARVIAKCDLSMGSVVALLRGLFNNCIEFNQVDVDELDLREFMGAKMAVEHVCTKDAESEGDPDGRD